MSIKSKQLQNEMPGDASKREADKLRKVLDQHGIEDMDQFHQLDDAELQDCLDEAEEE